MTFHTGDIVGDYRVLEPIGSGGMGAVYKAEHLITKRIEAMKALQLGIGNGVEEAARFEREIQVQARLQHPRIATLYSAVRSPNGIALLMEYVEGEPLQRLIERQRLPIGLAVGYACQVLDALEYAHKNGVIHCDVSPANILVTPSGEIKLTDFGLSRAAAELEGAAGIPMGSPWYMAPEQVRGVEAPDARTDVYAAAAVLYEMLAGRKLYDAESAFEVLQAQLHSMPKPPGAHSPGVPAAIDAAVLRALAKDRAARFESAAAFRAALEAAVRQPKRRSRLTAVVAPLIVSATLAAVLGAALLRTNRAQSQDPPAAPPATVPQTEPPAPVPAEPERVEPPPAAAPEVAAQSPAQPPASMPARARPREARRVETAEHTTPHGPRASLENPVTVPPSVQDHAPPPVAPIPAPAVETPYDTAVTPLAEAPRAEPAEEAKAEKGGNRFIRAIGKLNPFRRGTKKDKPEEKQR